MPSVVLAGGVVPGQLDVGQHLPAVALGHEQRAPLPGRLHGEGGAVHQPDPGGHRIDPQPVPGQVHERRGGHHLDAHPSVVSQQQATVRSATKGEPGTA